MLPNIRLARHLCSSTPLVCIYVCKDGTYAPKMRARATIFSKKQVCLGLTPVYSETTALSKPYFLLKRRSVRKFLRKRLLFKKQKVAATCYMALKTVYQI